MKITHIVLSVCSTVYVFIGKNIKKSSYVRVTDLKAMGCILSSFSELSQSILEKLASLMALTCPEITKGHIWGNTYIKFTFFPGWVCPAISRGVEWWFCPFFFLV